MSSQPYNVCLPFTACCCCVNEPDEYTTLKEEVKKDKDKEKNNEVKETRVKIPVHYILCEDEIVNNLSN